MKTEWRSIETDPPCPFGEQANILYCAEEWSWALVGVVSNFGTKDEWCKATGSLEHWPGHQYEFMIYDQINDRYEVLDRNPPTLWLPMPTPPSQEKED